MAKSVKGTQTEKNLLTSFAGESQARMRYTYFASTAKKEGYEQIAAIFTETADQEKEHAKRMFKWLEGGMVEITASYPAGIIGTTMEKLPLPVKMKNGLLITLTLLMWPIRKVFLLSLLCIAESLKLKRGMRKDIWLY